MFYKHNDSGYKQAIEGIQFKSLVYGEKSHLTQFQLGAGSLLPWHSHPHEQTGYLVSGHIRLTIDHETFEVDPGDSWCIPGNVQHSAEILEDSIAIEVFTPLREDYLR